MFVPGSTSFLTDKPTSSEIARLIKQSEKNVFLLVTGIFPHLWVNIQPDLFLY